MGSFIKMEESIVLSFRSEDEESGWVEGEGWLAGLIQIRSDIMRGDHRALYLGWLLALQSGEIDDDALEPPVPPGLGDLNAPLDRLADFLRVDSDLIATSAARSPGVHTRDLTKKETDAWLRTLSSKEKDAILYRVGGGFRIGKIPYPITTQNA